MVKISASLLSMRDNLVEKIKKLNESDIDYIHLDIMDNKFVPYSSYSYNEIKTIVSNINKPLDVHLMVSNISEYIHNYAMYNVEYITIHYEAMLETKVIDRIKSYGIKCGISIIPSTDVEQIYDLLDKIDLVLIMSVIPGQGEQEFIPSTIEKIKKLSREIHNRGLKVSISVDGGISDDNAKRCVDSGADMIVVGSYLNEVSNIKEEIKKFKNF